MNQVHWRAALSTTTRRSSRLPLAPGPYPAPVQTVPQRGFFGQSVFEFVNPLRRTAETTRENVEFVRASEKEREVFFHCFNLYSNFISVKEEALLIDQANSFLKNRTYEKGHWDGVIRQYRELEDEKAQRVIARARERTGAEIAWLEKVHLLDLLAEGDIAYHIDNQEVFGADIVTLSLISPAVLLFENKASGAEIRVHVPSRSLYIMRGAVRYEYGHAVLPSGTATVNGERIERSHRRISVLCRSQSQLASH